MSRSAWTQLVRSKGVQEPPPPVSIAPRARAKKKVDRKRFDARAVPANVPEVQVHDMVLMGKPRMTQRDRWKKRDCVQRYRAMKDELRLRGVKLPEQYAVIVYLPMPRSWTAKERLEHNGQRHQQKPDGDNIMKALQDCLVHRDESIHDGRVIKRWAYHGRVVILDTARVAHPGPEQILAWLPQAPQAAAA